MRKRRSKISWYNFFDKSKYKIKKVRSVKLVGLKGKTLTSVPTEPGVKPYLFVTLTVIDPDRYQESDHGDWYFTSSRTPSGIYDLVHIIIDDGNDRWQYVKMSGKKAIVANWPARFKFTHEMREQINEAVSDKFQEAIDA